MNKLEAYKNATKWWASLDFYKREELRTLYETEVLNSEESLRLYLSEHPHIQITERNTLKINGDDLAYPVDCNYSKSISKREYFAAMAMQGLVTDKSITYDTVAEFSIKMADRLISELNKPLSNDPN
jgi:hypothetical protein